ncbi:ABC transporter substrate-binding protein [Ruminococcus sp. 1001136sp1]|uniref:ABC transporter substrate-binding protein n=1 Tax=unclassified Ruminococcus TaxID=2608920 RepID=UPI00189F4202|nr:ABC transporter substrate-binding protein [Ruminococcus sp. 1001136sp1]MDB8773826.1 ABC transporter substrate-binding protein [Ruminococcus sp. 1001136sp1]MDB8785166.1 ABC transporter substrate-binding protein [Ruminococcus sp. 1001136sp1]
MKKQFIPLLAALCLSVADISVPVLAADTSEYIPSGIEYSGSQDACDVNVGLIMGPPSMGMGWFINEAKEGNTYNNLNFEVGGVDYTALASKFNTGDYDIIHCPSNVGAILYNNEDLKEDAVVIDIGNLGLLYVMTTDPSVKSMQDLQGRNVYSIGEGGPPEYTMGYLLEQEGLDNVNMSFKSTPFEVLNLLQDEENSIALLPQPFVEVAKLLVPGIYTPIDITEEWNSLNLESGAKSVTTITIVRKSFLEEHEEAVVEYLNMCKKSVDYCLENPKEAADWTDEFETFLNGEVAEAAVPYVNMCAITGQEMKDKLSGFLQIMYDYNPDAVGGAMPGDDFYYIPPEGSMIESTVDSEAVKEEAKADSETATDNSQTDSDTEETVELIPAEEGIYTVSANIWFKKEDSGLPMNPHITSDIFPPKDPVVDNATLSIDSDLHATVEIPILIKSRIMNIKEIEGLNIVDSTRNDDGYLTSITVDLGTIEYQNEVITQTCNISLDMGDLAMTISGFDKEQQWPATFQVNGFEKTGVQTADARGESSDIDDASIDAATAMAFGTSSDSNTNGSETSDSENSDSDASDGK